ncbi:carboxypeptidase regulatory-like domain-containing protein [Nocardioides cavernae]|uniref:alpha-amylase n=1 Tax=Nocardioides cavernae TaxID=1921566 RepID=A0ABR8N6E7_9ACTN|nr:carboxypeptidase regulatory-like domain-containing protein [Nocardioides cavernae]MBD3923713.1 carboxypeptidase regulatory-like domain-containing protein [Nocardioides cavernae]MBM7511354.1 5-hydroxyisourate hydrolase-like protein (transthyretin family) [Nocardioides cavernae]
MVTRANRRVAGPVGLFLLVLAVVLAPLAPASAAPGDPGTIAGTVYEPDFFEASGATVTLYNAAKVAVGSPQVTGADGTYEFGGLDGTYYVGATKSGVGTVFYDSAGTIANADAIAVDPDFGAEFVDLQLIPPPVIAGTVSNASGPIAGADVTAYEYDDVDEFWFATAFASTDASGHYELAGLAPKAYRLRFSALNHITEYWNDKTSVSTADDVTVVTGEVQQANALLAARTPVSGRVTGTGGANVANASVTAEQQVTDEFGDTYWDEVDFASSAADGTYTLRVPAGPTRISFAATGYLTEYYDNVLDAADAQLVQVGQTPVANVNAALTAGGRITGTVRTSGGTGIPSVSVTAYRLVGGQWQTAGSGFTDNAGSYVVDGLRTGSYRLRFQTFGAGGYLPEYYQDKDTLETATDVAVAQGATATADAVLDVGGQVSGTVTGPSGAVTGASVVLYTPSRFSSSGWTWSDSDTTTAGGAYSFTGLAPGPFRVCVDSATGLAPECWNDKPEVFAADTITAAKNSTATASFVLAAARKITGSVTSRAGGALTAPSVTAYRKLTGPDGAFWSFVSSTTPAAGGAYSLDVAPGTYRVSASANEHQQRFYSEPATSTRPTRIVVAAGADQTGKDIALDRYGRISGTVGGPSGALTGATVRVYRWSNPSFVQAGSVQTTAGGSYTFTGLNAGNYRVGFSAAAMTPEFNLDKSDVDLGDDVAVALNGTATVNATLASNQRTLSGTVTAAAGGAALADAEVRVERGVQTQDDVRWRSVVDLTTAADGSWSTTVPDGTYRLRFSRTGYLGQWYAGASTESAATPVVVSGSNRTGLNAALARAGTISGTVTGPAGPVTDGYVTVYREVAPGDFEDVDYASTSATGAWTVDSLAPGTYVVEIGADRFVTEYWNDRATLAAADRIVVGIGSTATANAALAAARTISGTLTGPTGSPLADADVTVERRYDDGEGGFYWDYYSDATTAAAGTWTTYVAPGTYRVEFRQSGHLVEWWNDAATAAAAQPVVVSASDVGSINAQLAAATVLRGRLSGPDGPVSGQVRVYPASATDLGSAPVLASDFAGSDGDYVIDTLPPGNYKVRFESYRLIPEFHLDKADLASANLVTLSTAAPVAVDATLARGRAITGTITGVGGAIDTASTTFYQLQTGGGYSFFDSDSTDADGVFRAHLPPGTYKISFSAYDNRISEWWNNAATQAAAGTVALGTGSDVTGIDAVLDDGATVTGTVTFPQRLSGWDSRVVIRDATTGAFATSAAVNAHANAYSVSNLVPGTYRAEFSRDAGYDVAEAQFYNGKAEHLGVGASQTFTLAAAATQAGVSAVLVEGGRLTGRVRDTSSNPVAGCVVTAYSGDGTRVGRDSRPSAADGSYVVPGLTTGSYLLRVVGGGCGPATAYYDGAGTVSPSAGSAVAVSATRATSTAVPQDLVIGPPDAPPMVNNSLPTVSDTTPEVGQTLTATTGTWTPADGTYAYQWLAGGSPVAGATTSSYAVVAGDIGKTLAVRVTASRAGFTSVSATSAATAAVPAPPRMTNTAVPTISDTTPAVAQSLTATPGTWTPSDGTYAYQWLADGAPVAGATTAAYTVVAADQGKVLSVRVTASKAGFVTDSATSAATSAVAPQPQVANTALPTISDTTPEVGQVLTAGDGTWTPSGVTLAYQWRSDGTDIGGAVSKTFQVPAGQLGKKLSVRVTAARAEHLPDSATSVETTAVVETTTVYNTVAPSISDTTPTVGEALTATSGTWTPSDSTFAYQWLADGSAIAGATTSGYTPVAGDVGKKLSVRVTASKTGWTGATATSAETAAVAAAVVPPPPPPPPPPPAPTPTPTPAPVPTPPAPAPAPAVITCPTPKVSGTSKVGKKLKAVIGTVSPTGVTVTYQWLRNGKKIKAATKATYKLTAADKGKKVSVKATYAKAGLATVVKTSAGKKVT